MTTGDRYNVPPSPGADIEQRFRNIEQYLDGLFNRTLRHSVLPQGSIKILDANGAEAVKLDQAGLTVAAGAITVGGGPVRAVDLIYTEQESSNVSLTTTMAEFAIVTVTPPAWATTVVLQAFCLFQLSNSSGGNQRMQYRAAVQGIPSSGAWSHDVGNGATGNVTDFYSRTLVRGTHFTTTVNASGWFGVNVGTNGANWVRTKATLFYLR